MAAGRAAGSGVGPPRSDVGGEPARGRWLRRLLGAVGLTLVFTGAVVAGALLHLDLPAPRRAAAVLVSRALSDTFEGRLDVGAFETLGPFQLEARDIRVHDAGGVLVATVARLHATYWAPDVLREYLWGGESWQVHIDHVRLDGAWALVLPGESDLPTLIEAFRVRSDPAKPSRGPSRHLTVAFPVVEVGHLEAEGRFGEAPPVQAELRSARGALQVTSDGATLDFDRFGLRLVAFDRWQARGLAGVHVRAPGPIWSSFDGELGDVPVSFSGRIEGKHVEVRAELPQIDPEAARALIPEWPLQTPIAARASAAGLLPELTARVSAELGGGLLSARGLLILEDGVEADVDIDTEGIDLAQLNPDLPHTSIDSRGALLLWSDGADISAELNGTLPASHVNGIAIPAVDFRGTYDGAGLEASATFHEQGVPAHLDLRRNPDGDVAFEARLLRTRLENSPRLRALLGARGTVEADVQGSLQGGHLDARLELRSSALRWREFGWGTGTLSARASGAIDAPSALQLSGRLRSTEAQAGALRLDRLDVRADGDPRSLSLELDARHGDGTEIDGRTRLDLSPLALRDAEVAILRRGARTSARLRHGSIGPGQGRLQGLQLESGGALEGDVRWSPGRYELDVRGAGLDLGRIAEAIAIPRNRLDGILGLDARVSIGDKSSGRLDIALEKASLWTVSGVDVRGSAEFDGRRSVGTFSGGVQGLGQLVASWDGTLAGTPVDPDSWHDGTGQAQISLDQINLDVLGRAISLPGTRSWGGEGYVRVSVARSEQGRLPQALFLVGTQRLSLDIDTAEGPVALDGVDVSLAGAVEGTTGKLAATGRVFDYRGDLMTLSTELETDLDALARELLRGRSPWPLLADRPLRAVAIVPYRDFAHFPTALRPEGYTGRGAARAVVTGSLAAPEVNLNLTAHQVSGVASPFMVPVDGETTLRYAPTTGKLQGSVLASREGLPVARGTFDLDLPWQNLTTEPEARTPLWTGDAQLVLDGLPLELIDTVAARRVRGSALGSIAVSRRAWVPRVRADVSLQRLEVGGARMGEGRFIADTTDDALVARAHFEDEFGSLTASARAGVVATGAGIEFAAEQPLRLTLEARQYDAKVISPFVRGVFHELSGPLNGTLQLLLEPSRQSTPETDAPWQAQLQGNMSLRGGVVEPAVLGLRLEDVSLVIDARPEGEYNVVSLDDIRARANSERENLRASGKIYLRNLDIEHARFDLDQNSVPLATGGVRLADLTGHASAVVEKRDEELAMTVDVPRMTAALPAQVERPLIELEDNPNIEVIQRRSAGEDLDDDDEVGTPLRIRFRLGDQVRVHSRLLDIRLRGGPELYVAEETRVTGSIELVPGGRVTVLGRTFVIDQGRVAFDTDEPSNPHLDVTATWRAPNGVLVMANVQGTAQQPRLSWSSDPGLPGGEAEVIALVLGGGGESRDASAGFAGALVNELLGQAGPRSVQLSVSRDTGTGRGQVARMSERTWDTVTATFQLSEEVWVEGSYLRPHDTAGAVNAQDPGFAGAIDWRFHPDWSLRTEAGNLGTGIDLLWRYRY